MLLRAWLTLVLLGCSGCAAANDANGSGGEPPARPCGPGRPVCSVDRCDTQICSWVEIARMPGPVDSLATDATHLYAITENGSAIYRVPKCGETTQVLARSPQGIAALALSGEDVYWIPKPGSSGRLFKAPKVGGPSERLLPLAGESDAISNMASLASDDDAVYLAQNSPPGLVRLDPSGVTELQSFGTGFPLLQDATDLYFQAGYGTGVSRLAKTGGEAVPLFDVPENGRLSALQGPFLYYQAHQGTLEPVATVMRRRKDGASAELVATFEAQPRIAVDDTCLYSVETVVTDGVQDTELTRRPLPGGPLETLLSSKLPAVLTVDADSIYLADWDGSLRRRPK